MTLQENFENIFTRELWKRFTRELWKCLYKRNLKMSLLQSFENVITKDIIMAFLKTPSNKIFHDANMMPTWCLHHAIMMSLSCFLKCSFFYKNQRCHYDALMASSKRYHGIFHWQNIMMTFWWCHDGIIMAPLIFSRFLQSITCAVFNVVVWDYCLLKVFSEMMTLCVLVTWFDAIFSCCYCCSIMEVFFFVFSEFGEGKYGYTVLWLCF